MPHLAPRFSDRDLAEHYNATGELPSPVLFVDERVGSFPFYLSPALRAQLSPSRLRSVMPSEAFGMKAAPPDAVFILTTERAESIARFVNWERLPSQVVGHHVIVGAGSLIQAVRTGRSAPPGGR